MIGPVVAVRGPLHVNVSIHQTQSGAVGLAQSVELNHAAVIAVACAADVDLGVIGVIAGARGRANDIGSGGIGAVGQVDGVKPLNIVGIAADDFLGIRVHVKNVGGQVNDRRAGDADLRVDVARASVSVRNAGDGSCRRRDDRCRWSCRGTCGAKESLRWPR